MPADVPSADLIRRQKRISAAMGRIYSLSERILSLIERIPTITERISIKHEKAGTLLIECARFWLLIHLFLAEFRYDFVNDRHNDQCQQCRARQTADYRDAEAFRNQAAAFRANRKRN